MRKMLMVAGIILLGSIQALALGTSYGTNVQNTATLSYQVGGNSQNAIVSNTDTFVVDRKVIVTVATTDTTNVIVVPGDNAPTDSKPLTFTVTNNTNGNQDYILSATNLATGTASLTAGKTDNTDFTADLKICTSATCSGGDISGTNVSFTADQTQTFYVFADIPLTATDGNVASIALTATAVNDGTTTPMVQDTDGDDPAAVEIVFAEGAGVAPGDAQFDGKHSALSAYEVATATLSATKSSCIVSDPVRGTTNPMRIPGAVIRYAIEVSNTGSADATSVTITDTVDVAFGTSAANLEVRSGACAGIDAATNACAPRTGTVENNPNTAGAGTATVTLDYATVAVGATECGYFEVTIQ